MCNCFYFRQRRGERWRTGQVDEEVEPAWGDKVVAQPHGQRSHSGLSGNCSTGEYYQLVSVFHYEIFLRQWTNILIYCIL